MSKLIERVVFRQIADHFTENNLFVPVQYAYRSHHSTETALLRVMNDLLLASDDGNGYLLTLLDFSAAFDTIDHRILFERLETRFGITGGSLERVKSYMTERSQLVCVPGAESSPVILDDGVPQGSVLGSLIFILYSSPLSEIISRFGIVTLFLGRYTQLYMSFPITILTGKSRELSAKPLLIVLPK
jgi:hypothetical protein